jgi:hypothetical protein
MCSDTQCKSHVVAKGSDIRTGLASDTEKHKASFDVKDPEGMNGPDPQVPLDRTLLGRTLINSSGILFCDLFDPLLVCITVEPHETDIFLVMLEEQGSEADCIAEHDKQDTGDLRIKRP